MQLAEMTPKPGTGFDPGITTISAKIPNYQSLDPQSVGMALLSLGTTVPYSYDARSGEITLMLSEALSSLKSKYHRAVVWATDMKTGKRVEATWVFKKPEEEKPLPVVTPVLASTVPAAHTGGSPKR
jgi:hypothetical protein